MPIFKFDSNSLQLLEETTFESEDVFERRDLQRLLRQQPEVVSPDTLIISEEFGEWEDSRRRIDLLGVDKQARLVVIELKRDESGGHMELQAVRYAAMVSTLTFEKTVEIYAQYLERTNQQKDARKELLGFLGWDAPQENEFASDVCIVLAAAEFSKELTTAVLWLNARDLDIRCVRLKPYKGDGKVFIDVQQIIPLPEAEEYQIRVRNQTEQRREARRSEMDFTKYSFEGQVFNKRKLVLAVVRAFLLKSPETKFDLLKSVFPDEIRGGRGVFLLAEEAEEEIRETGSKVRRHFLDKEDILVTADNRRIAVSNQWSKETIDVFCAAARKLGFVISEIK